MCGIVFFLVLFQTASEARSLEVMKRSHPKFVCVSICVYVCLSVCPSVRPSVLYLLLDHWRNRNEIFRGRRPQPLDSYYIVKTYCYYVNFKVICEKPVSCLILVAHIHTYLAQETLWPTSLTSLSTFYLPFYLLPSFLPPTAYLPFYLLPPFLPPIPLLPPTSLSTSHLPFYLLPPFLPPLSNTPFEKSNILHSNISHRY